MAKAWTNSIVSTEPLDSVESWRKFTDVLGMRKRPIWRMFGKGEKPLNPAFKWTALQIKETTLQSVPEQDELVQPKKGKLALVYYNYCQMFVGSGALAEYAQQFPTISGDANLQQQIAWSMEEVMQQQELRLLHRAATAAAGTHSAAMGSLLPYFNENRETGRTLGTNKGGYNTGTNMTSSIDSGTATPAKMKESTFNSVFQKIAEQGVNATDFYAIAGPAMFSALGKFATNNERQITVANPPGAGGATVSNYVGIYITETGFRCKLLMAPFAPKYTDGSNRVTHDVILADPSRVRIHDVTGFAMKKLGRRGYGDAFTVSQTSTCSVDNPKGSGSLVDFLGEFETG